MLAKRNFRERKLLRDRADAIAGKRRLAEDHVFAPAREHPTDQIDELVRAVAEAELVFSNSMVRG